MEIFASFYIEVPAAGGNFQEIVCVDIPEGLGTDAPKIILCNPKLTFPPRRKKIKANDPKIIRVQKNLPPPYTWGGGEETMQPTVILL